MAGWLTPKDDDEPVSPPPNNIPKNIGNIVNDHEQRLAALEHSRSNQSNTAPPMRDFMTAPGALSQGDKNYVAQVIKDAEQHRNQGMYDRVQWQAAEIQNLQQQLRLASVREERVQKLVAMVEEQTGVQVLTDSQGNVRLVAPNGQQALLPTGYTGHLNGGKQLGK
jgi:hypothetical protein